MRILDLPLCPAETLVNRTVCFDAVNQHFDRPCATVDYEQMCQCSLYSGYRQQHTLLVPLCKCQSWVTTASPNAKSFVWDDTHMNRLFQANKFNWQTNDSAVQHVPFLRLSRHNADLCFRMFF